MINFASLLYSRSLSVFGSPAVITIPPAVDASPVVVTITGIDRTAGVEVTDHSIGVRVIRPAVDVRRTDLDAAGLSLSALDGASLTINGTNWTVAGVMENPTPFGPSDGTVSLLLVGNA